jgi:lambda family phage portal protein
MQQNWLDRAISWFSPRSGLLRTRARYVQDAINGWGPRNKYEGASRSRRTEGWRTTGASADAEISSGIFELRNRSRDLVRNNPYASRAISVISTHVVGTGIIPQTKGRTKKQTKTLEDLAKEFLDTQLVDADGRNNLYGLQRLAQRAISESGEVIIRRRRRLASDGLPLPFQVQVLEGDYLDSGKTGTFNGGNFINQGIEYNGIGKRLAYWLFTEHPGDTAALRLRSFESVRVPAEDIIHSYRMDRPGQMRGVPWASPIIIRMRDFDEYEDAQLLRQKIAACYTGFVYDDEFGVSQPTPDGSVSSNPLVDKIEPGIIELLPSGKRIEFADPPGVDGYADYAGIQLHAIGAGYGVPYDLLTTDQSKVNFASGRLGRLAFDKDVDDWRWLMLIPQVCDGIWGWFLNGAELTGVDTSGSKVVWSPPRRQMINPEKEVPASRDEVRSGQITLSESIRQRGYDPDEFFREYADDMATLDTLGLVLDSDPRRTNRGGTSQSEVIENEDE